MLSLSARRRLIVVSDPLHSHDLETVMGKAEHAEQEILFMRQFAFHHTASTLRCVKEHHRTWRSRDEKQSSPYPRVISVAIRSRRSRCR